MGTDEPNIEETNSPEVTEALNDVEAALDGGLDVDSPEVSAKLEELKRKLGVVDSQPDERGPQQHTGADVDWSEYDLDPKFAHLYPASRLEMTAEGPRWVVQITEFKAIKGPYEATNKYPDIGRVITQMINGPEGWRLQSAVVPVNNTVGIATLQRMFPIILPTPMLLKNQASVEVAPPTAEELAAQEAQALAWANGEGTPPTPPSTPAEAVDGGTLSDKFNAALGDNPPAQPVPGAVAAANEFIAASGDLDRPNDQ